ncbi:asparagine synthase-related protein [Phenylobacterium sp.]|uniref:asparagine synthase-related protein n=1 Tax=Phenylobacterium sp. TaxID=1871053 RepID=UPI002E36054E|nr:asparagine synthase-related protein [Phenylobacterium sp.]HEX4712529.1 asparagine synthase-related protein [Phenylobacterium sp.]
MADFIALAWPPADERAGQEAQALETLIARTGDWTSAWRQSGLAVWTRGSPSPAVRDLGDVVTVGVCLQTNRTQPYAGGTANGPGPPIDVAGTLCAEAWGAYVGLVVEPNGLAVFRDPSGGLDCFAWSRGQIRIATSETGPLPRGLLPPHIGLNWQAIAQWCLDPGVAADLVALDQVNAVPAGCLLELNDGPARVTPVWRPSRFVSRVRDKGGDAAAGLVAAVDLAVEGLVRPHDRILGELSGGLDSAIVASALVQGGFRDRAAGWLNYYGDRAEGDERAYAAAVADRLALKLCCVARPVAPLTESDFATTARGLRPAFGAVDPPRDRDSAARLEASGATAMLTGQGGDVVFFQMPTPLIMADQVWHGGWRSLTPRRVGEAARFARKPAWSVLAAMGWRSAALASFRRPGLAADGIAAAPPGPDPWSADAAQLPPAKRYQVTALYQTQLSLTGSRRRSAADILSPLLSQPVVEHCLGLSVPELVDGRRDRALARRAFEGRLPAMVTARRSKGDLTAHYGRVIAASLGFLRPWLLDGCLCEAGLLDRAKVEAALQLDQLILRPLNSEILIAALIEAWVRWWQTQAPDCAQAPRLRP